MNIYLIDLMNSKLLEDAALSISSVVYQHLVHTTGVWVDVYLLLFDATNLGTIMEWDNELRTFKK